MPIKSIVYGGGGAAPVPGMTNKSVVLQANQEIIKYLREKFPAQGLYYALGPNDFYPHNY